MLSLLRGSDPYKRSCATCVWSHGVFCLGLRAALLALVGFFDCGCDMSARCFTKWSHGEQTQ